jgi:hypothetical protein
MMKIWKKGLWCLFWKCPSRTQLKSNPERPNK